MTLRIRNTLFAVFLLTLAVFGANLLTRVHDGGSNQGVGAPRAAMASSFGPTYATPAVLAAQGVGTITAGTQAWVVTPPGSWTYNTTCPSTCDGTVACVTAGGLDGGSGCWVQVIQQPNRWTYQQGGTASQQRGIYTTWASVWSAMTTAAASTPTIVIDGSLGTPVITPGNYALPSGLTLLGVISSTTLTIQDGAHFTSTGSTVLNINALGITNLSTTSPFWTTSTGFVEVDLINGSNISSQAATTTQPFLLATGGYITCPLNFNGYLNGIVGGPIFSATSPGQITVWDGQYSSVYANSLAGSGSSTIIVTDQSGYYDVQPAVSGTFSVYQPQLPANKYPALSLSAAGGAQSLPARPAQTTAPTPSYFLGTPSGNQASATTYTLPLTYKALDIVRILFTKTQLAAANVTVVDGGSGTPTLGVIVVANVGTNGSGYIDAQLNATLTHWTLVGAGSQ